MPHLLAKHRIIRETDGAYLLCPVSAGIGTPAAGRQQFWVPKAVIESQDVYDEEDVGDFEVATWFARKEGLD